MDSLGRERGKECGRVKAFDRLTEVLTHGQPDSQQKKTGETEDVEVKQQAHRVQIETGDRDGLYINMYTYMCLLLNKFGVFLNQVSTDL